MFGSHERTVREPPHPACVAEAFSLRCSHEAIGTLDKGLNQAGVHFSLQYIVKGTVILAAVYLDVRRRK